MNILHFKLVVLLTVMIPYFCADAMVDIYETTSGYPEPVWYDIEIVNRFPHDPEAYTQGLVFRDGYLYESTGIRGRSSLRKVHLETGQIIQNHEIASEYFAEGLTDWGDKLIQITLDAGIGFIYDRETFSVERTTHYAGRGWGLTNNEKWLVMSDGSSYLHFLDPVTFKKKGRLYVKEGSKPLENLNELEMVGGKIYANVLHSNYIAVINSKTGYVEGQIDLEQLLLTLKEEGNSINVPNGIAYDRANDRLFITGKFWPALFEIRIYPRK